MTPPHLIDARPVGGHRLWLRYDDGRQGEIDLADELSGPVFEPLRDLEFFRTFTINPDFHTLQWPNGADFAPEFLRAKLVQSGAQRTDGFTQ